MALFTVKVLLPFVVAASTSHLFPARYTSTQLSSAVFAALRVYALCDRSLLLAALVGILSMVPFVSNAVGHPAVVMAVALFMDIDAVLGFEKINIQRNTRHSDVRSGVGSGWEK